MDFDEDSSSEMQFDESAMHDHVEKFGDDATREGVGAMIR